MNGQRARPPNRLASHAGSATSTQQSAHRQACWIRASSSVCRASWADPCLVRTLRPIVDGFLIGPARRSNAPAKIVETRLRYLDFEGADGGVAGRSGLRGVGSRKHKHADRKRSYRSGKKAVPSRRRETSCIHLSTSYKGSGAPTS